MGTTVAERLSMIIFDLFQVLCMSLGRIYRSLKPAAVISAD